MDYLGNHRSNLLKFNPKLENYEKMTKLKITNAQNEDNLQMKNSLKPLVISYANSKFISNTKEIIEELSIVALLNPACFYKFVNLLAIFFLKF